MKKAFFPSLHPPGVRPALLPVLLALFLPASLRAADAPAPEPGYFVGPNAERTDGTRSLRELATLASFPFTIRQTPLGYASTPELNLAAVYRRPYGPWQSEMCARIARLTRTEDAEVAEAAARLQPILRSGYQLNCLNADFGNTPENAAKRSKDMLNRGFDFARSFMADEDRAQTKIVHGGDGVTYYVQGESFHLSEDTQHAIADFQAEYGSMWKEVQGQALFTGLVEMARGLRQIEAAAIWQKTLYPRLAALGSQKAANDLVEVAPMYSFPASPSVRATWQYGQVTFGNAKLPLTNVLVRVTLQDTAADRTTAYLFLPALSAGQYVQVEVPSDFAPLARSTRKLVATFDLICDQGRINDRSVDFTELQPPSQTVAEAKTLLEGFRKQAEDLLRQAPKLYAVSDPQQAVTKLRETLSSGQVFAGRHRGEVYLVRCDSLAAGTPTLNTRVSIGEGAVTTNTQLVGRLMAEVERGAVLAFKNVSSGEPLATLVTSSRQPGFAAPIGVAREVAPTQTGPNRGGLTDTRDHPQPFRAIGARGAKANRPPAPVPPPPKETPPARPSPPARLLSSPAEIADFSVYRARKDSPMNNPLVRIFTGDIGGGMDLQFHSHENTANADFVLSVDPQGQLWLQLPRDGDGNVAQIAIARAEPGK